MKEEYEFWETTVGEVLSIFRSALLSLVPAMDAARIPWRDNQAYDDWDNIVEVLFKNIVHRSLLFARELTEDIEIPPYGITGLSYDTYGAILVCTISNRTTDGKQEFVFVGFNSQRTPFDTVVCISNDAEQTVVTVPLPKVSFQLMKQSQSKKDKLSRLTIEL